MARFSRAIPPGGEGWVSLEVNTKGYSGKVHKSARIYSNDPKNGSMRLNISALVNVPINVSVRTVNLTGYEDQEIKNSVLVTAGEPKPLKLEPIDFSLSDRLSYQIQEIEKDKQYKIIFKNIIYGPVGYYKGILKLKTNYKEKPELSIPVRLNIRKKPISKNNRDKG